MAPTITGSIKARKSFIEASRSKVANHASLTRRLLASALGGATLALAGVLADAAVLSSGIQNITVTSMGSGDLGAIQILSLNPADGSSPEFNFGWENTSALTGHAGSMARLGTQYSPGSRGAFSYVLATSFSLYNFSAGATVGPATPVGGAFPTYGIPGVAAWYGASDGSNTYEATVTTTGGTGSSNWAAGGSGFAGFQFLDADLQPHYGWMQASVPTTSAADQGATLVQWAWESTPNTPITINPVPEPAAWMSAALGILGLVATACRRRQGTRPAPFVAHGETAPLGTASAEAVGW